MNKMWIQLQYPWYTTNCVCKIQNLSIPTTKILCFDDRASLCNLVNKTNLVHNSSLHVYFYSLHGLGDYVPIIRRNNCINTTPGICHSAWMTVWYAGWDEFLIPASKQAAVPVWHIPVAVCTVLNAWWWTERPSETCGVLFQNKINLRSWCIWLDLL
jgi:hypothetical protein